MLTNKRRAWVEPLLHKLAHGQEARVLTQLERLRQRGEELGDESRRIIERETDYFQTHRKHLHYEAVQAQECPKGSGAVESTCG
ncbi:hypothetical protein AMJ85_06855 [candidate division BRC1 bacterium SM23_51]|nr:MAG: hypothetical protein AMJ85_06855 [candidate division BRC1 bacterium SM23_51]